jgi:hypothetical protein
MKTIKTAEATGPALDWLVAKCEGIEVAIRRSSVDRHMYLWLPLDMRTNECGEYSPSTNWAQGGAIIERARIAIQPVDGYLDFSWVAAGDSAMLEVFPYEGTTALEAAMRCYVAAQLGDKVEIPEEL